MAVEAAAAKVARAAGGEGGGDRPRASRACGALVPITSKQPAHGHAHREEEEEEE